jgi:hypothetical protein
MRRLVVVIVMSLRVAWAQPADPKAAAAKAAQDAEARYRQHDYAAAAEQFKLAYTLDADPVYLFDIAQAYRFASDCTSSADYYRQFLVKVPDPPNAAKVKAWLQEEAACAAAVVHTAAAVPPPSPPSESPGTPAPPVTPEVTATVPVLATVPVPATASTVRADFGRQRGGYTRLAIVATGVGVAALGVAGFFSWDGKLLANNEKAVALSCTNANPCPASNLSALTSEKSSYDSRGARANAIATGSYIGGGVALAAGAALYVMGGFRESHTIAITPIRNGAMVGTTFGF